MRFYEVVGYESASQFNWEYRRFFGQQPLRDGQTLRHAMAAGANYCSQGGIP
jgi:hypothetical protein